MHQHRFLVSFWPRVWASIFLQPLGLQGCIVPPVKDLIHICLEPEVQGRFRTFNVLYLASKRPYLLNNRPKSRFNLQGTVNSKKILQYSGVRLRRDAYNKSLCKWGHFEKAKTTFKMLLATWFLMCFFIRFRFFNAKNLGSVGQRAAKLPAIKLWEWFETVQASNPGTLADWGWGRLADLSWDLQLWQLVILQPFNLQTPNF